jgi:hypothetical protein
VPGGIEDLFDDLTAATDPGVLMHRHGVRFVD